MEIVILSFKSYKRYWRCLPSVWCWEAAMTDWVLVVALPWKLSWRKGSLYRMVGIIDS
jgi:hypothetical protein